jgi:hypothetical protein
LASNASSIPEISDLIQFFNPHDPVGLIALIMRTVQDSAWRDDTEAMIRATFRMTRWSDTAEQVLNLLETL